MKPRTVDDVHELMGAHIHSAALNAALELGLFWKLADGPRPLVRLSQELAIPVQRCHYWLQILAKLGLLDREGELVSVTPVARQAILEVHSQHTWKMLAIDAMDNYADGVSLAQRLLAPGSGEERGQAQPDHLPGYVRRMAEDLERARFFAHMLFELHMPLAEAVADALELDGVGRLLDVGGGSGVVSLALLRKWPELRAIIVDIPNNCIVGREIADCMPERDRISYYPADFVLDELPGGFDVVLECDVAQFDNNVLSKLAATLDDGGRLVIVDRWFDMGKEESLGRLGYLLRESLAHPEFSAKSIEEVQEGMVWVGLEPEGIVDLPYKKWKMISARKSVSMGIGHPQVTDFPGRTPAA
jgi:hypothetical protein